jgi:hypothetical protein
VNSRTPRNDVGGLQKHLPCTEVGRENEEAKDFSGIRINEWVFQKTCDLLSAVINDQNSPDL